jgi:hypothetical protein
MPYPEIPSFPNPKRGNPALAVTWERLKDKLRAHGVNGWCDELPNSISRSESAGAASVLIAPEAQRGKRIP